MFTLPLPAGLLCAAFALALPGAGAAEPPKEPEFPAVPALPAGATPLRKAQAELVREGLEYVKRCRETIRAGAWLPGDFRRYADVLVETCRTAAELEEKPANRARWFEERVRLLKEVEDLVARAVRVGNMAPHDLNLIRFQRLQAEVDLLKFKAEAEKANGK